MAVPKRKLSRSHTRHRRSAWKTTAPQLVTVRVDGRDVRVPRRLVAAVHRGLVDTDALPTAPTGGLPTPRRNP